MTSMKKMINQLSYSGALLGYSAYHILRLITRAVHNRSELDDIEDVTIDEVRDG